MAKCGGNESGFSSIFRSNFSRLVTALNKTERQHIRAGELNREDEISGSKKTSFKLRHVQRVFAEELRSWLTSDLLFPLVLSRFKLHRRSISRLRRVVRKRRIKFVFTILRCSLASFRAGRCLPPRKLIGWLAFATLVLVGGGSNYGLFFVDEQKTEPFFESNKKLDLIPK